MSSTSPAKNPGMAVTSRMPSLPPSGGDTWAWLGFVGVCRIVYKASLFWWMSGLRRDEVTNADTYSHIVYPKCLEAKNETK